MTLTEPVTAPLLRTTLLEVPPNVNTLATVPLLSTAAVKTTPCATPVAVVVLETMLVEEPHVVAEARLPPIRAVTVPEVPD